jgi:protein-S-isoprenylcysteine O-methyltransferase Ste14
MKATTWEFKNRAWIFGLMLAVTFPMYAIDPQNSAAALANWLAPRLRMDADFVARLLFALAAVVLGLAAFIRTWASSYLHAQVVYASEVKTKSLVADGPYRFVRNPLYLGNVLMAFAMGAMMSRFGFVTVVVAMIVFSYRLILREEAELEAGQGEQYELYRKAVPRLWPSPWPRTPSAGSRPSWTEGFAAESYYWGFALAVGAFALTLKQWVFFVILGISLVLFWVAPSLLLKKSSS